MKSFPNIVIPEFDKEEFNLTPNNALCEVIDTTRLMVELLWWVKHPQWEISDSDFSSKVLIDGEYSLVMRYKREKDGGYRPACILSFDQDNAGNIMINQLQWTKDKHIGFRFHSSFKHIEYFIKLIEESFIKKWIYVEVKNIPEWLEGVSYASQAHKTYQILSGTIHRLNKEYGVKPQKTLDKK